MVDPRIFLVRQNGPGEKGSFPLSDRPLVIGKSAESDIVAEDSFVSGRHAEVFWDAARKTVRVRDLGSRNGTFIDGRKIKEEPLAPGQVLKIGGTLFSLKPAGAEVTSPSAPQPVKKAGRSEPSADEQLVMDERDAKTETYKRSIEGVFLDRLNRTKVVGEDSEALRRRVEGHIDVLLSEFPLPAGLNRGDIKKSMLADILGYGPLEKFLEDEAITEIMVNSESKIYVEKGGRLYATSQKFRNRDHLLNIIDRVVAPLGRRIDESSPMVDARLPDGSRVNAVVPPLAIDGPSMTIRKFSKKSFIIEDLIKWGSISESAAGFLRLCVENRLNILISGGTGTGKTTLLNILSSFIPDGERVITIEDSAELRLPQPHVVRLESRPANVEGKGRIGIRELVINALRMRPDRIVVGECRGGEALDMIQAMSTGHDGSLTTAHANSPRDAVRRLEIMCLMAGMDLPLRAIREQIASAIHLVVQISRFRDGTRKVTTITEITGMEKDIVTMQDLFVFKNKGSNPDGTVKGYYTPCGNIPNWMDRFRERDVGIDISMFKAVEKD